MKFLLEKTIVELGKNSSGRSLLSYETEEGRIKMPNTAPEGSFKFKRVIKYVQILIILNQISQQIICSKAEPNEWLVFRESGWRNATSREVPLRVLRGSAGGEGAKQERSGKLIEWDDDPDIQLDQVNLNRSYALRPLTSNHLHDVLPKMSVVKPTRFGEQMGRKGSFVNRLVYHGRLEPKREAGANSSVASRVDDGLEMLINTHQPVTISRRSFGGAGWLRQTSSTALGKPLARKRSWSTTDELQSRKVGATSEEPERNIYSPIKKLHSRASTINQEQSNDINPITQDSSASDWRPIVYPVTSSSRARLSSKELERPRKESLDLRRKGRQEESWERNLTAGYRTSESSRDKKGPTAENDDRWKPIRLDAFRETIKKSPSVEHGSNSLDESLKPISMARSKLDSIISNKRTIEIKKKQAKKSSIEEPFDDADEDLEGIEIGLEAEREDSLPDEKRKDKPPTQRSETNKLVASNQVKRPSEEFEESKWTPLAKLSTNSSGDESQTDSPRDLGESSTIVAVSSLQQSGAPSSSGNTSLAGASNSSTEQRSASDLSYIYSSQPQQQVPISQLVNAAGPSTSYYSSNYAPSPQQQQPIQPSPLSPPELTLIDTVSGQTPEMIVDRTPTVEPASTGGGYSQPVVAATFQPAPQPPSRQPYYGGYGGGGNTGYESPQPQSVATVGSSLGGGGYGNSFYAPAQQFRAQQQPQQTLRQQQQPQVVRQEHHYHYYNNNQQQQPQGQEQRQAVSQVSQAPGVQPTVIRELQPIMISQPVIQQQSTTAAPQTQTIIREIVKEVPVQQVQTVQMPARIVQISPQPTTIVQLAPSIQPPQLPPIIRDIGPIENDFPQQPTSNYANQVPAAQRLIRQLSSTLPQVALRMPQPVAPFRLQLPTMQLSSLRQQSNPAPVTRQTGSFIIPPVPKKTTTYMTETQAMPTHTTIMQTTQFTPATRTTVFTTDHQQPAVDSTRMIGQPNAASVSYK